MKKSIKDTVRDAIQPTVNELGYRIWDILYSKIGADYYLEVSSPGIERELRTDEHILLSIGQKVEAKLFVQKDGRKSFTGILTEFDGDAVTFDCGGETAVIPKNEIAKITTVYFE